MIVPMRQFSILVYHRDFAAFMGRLQEEGLLDIRQEEIHSSKADTEFYPVLERVGKVLSQLKAEKKEMPEGKDFSAGKAGGVESTDRAGERRGESRRDMGRFR